jgi:hypothetical protein
VGKHQPAYVLPQKSACVMTRRAAASLSAHSAVDRSAINDYMYALFQSWL